MASTAPARKRKRDDAEGDGSGQVTFAVRDSDASALGPVLASFPAIQPPASTKFLAYQTRPVDANTEFASKPVTIVGATKTIEYYTSTETETSARGCRYYIGVRNKKTNVLTIRPAPVHILSRRVKGLDDAATLSNIGSQWAQQRNELGETFGTKKALKAIRAAERRKIDISAMEGVTGHIQDSIETNTKLLPTQDEAQAIAQSGRLIPPHNMNATTPQDAYHLHDIIPEAEFNTLPVSHAFGSGVFDECIESFPQNRSEYVRQHLKAIISAPKPDKRKYKILMYLACLLTFHHGGFKVANNKEELQHRMRRAPIAVIDGIVSRFTEIPRGTSTPTYTHDNETLLQAYLFVLCLHLDDFAVDTSLIAPDLRQSVSIVNQQFKVLGCKIRTLSPTELSNRGIPTTQAQKKYAVLTMPLQFPKPRAGKRR